MQPMTNWKAVLAKNPTIISALLGGGIGSLVGGSFSDEGAEGRGAMQGALLGSLVGAGGGKVLHSIAKRAPTPEGSLITGAIAGGTAGGYLGKRHISPWLMQHLQETHGNKEASVANETELEKKAAMEKEAELNRAFDFGMDLFFSENGISRPDLIKRANDGGAKVDDASLAEATIAWVSSLLEEKK